MRVNKRAGWMFGLLIVVGIIGLTKFVSRNPPLLSRATVADGQLMIENLNYYYWISDHELLLVKGSVTGADEANWRFVRRDVRSGKETSLTRLSARFPHHIDTLEYATVSSDGRWLLWRNAAQIGVSEIDGARELSWKDDFYPDGIATDHLYWQSDSRHFIELIERIDEREPVHNAYPHICDALIRDVQTPSNARLIPVPDLPELAAMTYYGPPCATPRGELFTWAPSQEESAARTLLYVPLASGSTAHRHRLHAPPGMLFDYVRSQYHNAVALSPRGDRITWLCQSHPYIPVLQDLLGRVWPRLRPRTLVWVSLCESTADGTEMHQLGGIEIDADDYDDSHRPSDVRWLPNGRNVSFEYRGTLYTIPAD